MTTPELLQKIAKGLSETNTKCTEMELNVNEDGSVYCKLYIDDVQLLDRFDFADFSGIESKYIHIPEKILEIDDTGFTNNNKYFTIKI